VREHGRSDILGVMEAVIEALHWQTSPSRIGEQIEQNLAPLARPNNCWGITQTDGM